MTGAGIAPVFTRRQIVSSEQANSAWTTGMRTKAASGRRSKSASAAEVWFVLFMLQAS